MKITSQAVPHNVAEDACDKPRTTRKNIYIVLIAGYGSAMFGYANNAVVGSLAQTSFINKFLSGPDADSVVSGIISG